MPLLHVVINVTLSNAHLHVKLFCRSWFSVYCLSKSSGHNAFPTDLVCPVLRYASTHGHQYFGKVKCSLVCLPSYRVSVLLSNRVFFVLNVFIDIQTSKELIQMDTDKMMTYGTFIMDDETFTQS